tara:strand:+ start:947 stop:1279 length:333 start_codon:yes stop_codon:yes gene_type:complete
MAINSVLISSTDTEALNVPSGKKYAITTLLVCNYATSTNALNDSTFNMHVLNGSGDVKSNTNKVLNSVSMPAQETFTWNVERLILEEGDRVILNSADSDKLSATISFLEV